ncbi:helix-turn-helix transcriptional regulator [Mycoplasmatota bacterium WC44]
MNIKSVKEFGNAVRYYRLKQKISQDELGRLSGLHRTYIGSVERGEKNATIKTVLSLALALKIEPSDLFQVK